MVVPEPLYVGGHGHSAAIVRVPCQFSDQNLRSFNAITHTHLFQLCLLQQFLVSHIRQFECLQRSQQLNPFTAWACTVHASLVMHTHTIKL